MKVANEHRANLADSRTAQTRASVFRLLSHSTISAEKGYLIEILEEEISGRHEVLLGDFRSCTSDNEDDDERSGETVAEREGVTENGGEFVEGTSERASRANLHTMPHRLRSHTAQAARRHTAREMLFLVSKI